MQQGTYDTPQRAPGNYALLNDPETGSPVRRHSVSQKASPIFSALPTPSSRSYRASCRKAFSHPAVIAVVLFLLLLIVIIPCIVYYSKPEGSAPAQEPGTSSSSDSPVTPTTRVYYVSAGEVEWDYCPGLDPSKLDAVGQAYVTNSRTQIGCKYNKVLYREYTDDSFKTLKVRPAKWEHLGLVGPLVRAAVGDTIKFTFRNNAAKQTFTVHVHGVFYSKPSEGAAYADGCSNGAAPGAGVKPGETFTYVWNVPARAGPGPNDQSSIAWVYHSHTDEPADANGGLFGAIIVTDHARANQNGEPKDVDAEVLTVASVLDENASHFLVDNIKSYAPDANSNDPAFMDANLKASINGFVFDTMPLLEFEVGQQVRWYAITLGTERDVHTLTWEGQTILYNGHRSESWELLPGSQMTVDLLADHVGDWYVHCAVPKHLVGGLHARYRVKDRATRGAALQPVVGGRVRRYYVAAVEVDWNYAPSGLNNETGKAFTVTEALYAGESNAFLSRVFRKAVFREYTDDTFSKEVTYPEMGLAGPVLRAAVGDTIVVHFMNKASLKAFNMVPNLVFDDLSNPATGSVPPNGRRTFQWYVPARAGPGPSDSSSKVWTYSSRVDDGDIDAGLIGGIVVTAAHLARPGGEPADLERELLLLLALTNERKSPYYPTNVALYLAGGGTKVQPANEQQIAEVESGNKQIRESLLKRSVNGYLYGNAPGLEMIAGERVRWYVVSVGGNVTVVDRRPIRFEGQTLWVRDRHVEVVDSVAGTTLTVDMFAARPGVWSIQCANDVDFLAGMSASFTVIAGDKPLQDSIGSATVAGQTRRLFIRAEEVEWDYVPTGKNVISGTPLGDAEAVYAGQSDTRIGHKYIKSLFREYTDASFAKVAAQPPFLGMLGPIIRAEVGDTIVVTFENKASRPVSIELPAAFVPMGNASIAEPNTQVTYQWYVTEAAGPSSVDASSVVWTYQSGVDLEHDLRAGLVGPVIVTSAGNANLNGSPVDVDRELVMMLMVVDENLSPYLDQNIAKYTKGKTAVGDLQSEEFFESNRMHSINGFLFGNIPGLDMSISEKVRWYLISVGVDGDSNVHAAHFHGNTLLANGHRIDTQDLLPTTTKAIDMIIDNAGTWLFHCHVNDHIYGGMMAVYRATSTNGTLPC